MSSITISLPDEDLAFLRSYAEARGMTMESVIARQTRILRQHLEAPLPPEVIAATGTIAAPRDGEGVYRDHLEEKYQRP